MTASPSIRRGRRARGFLSYFILSAMALVMLLPLLWLLNGSLQPGWQIDADPVVWLPRHWNATPAGNTGRSLLLWRAPAGQDAKEEVIQLGVRRYTTVVDLDKLTAVASAPRSELTDAAPGALDGITVNIREWRPSGGASEQVVALARDPQHEDNLLIARLDALKGALSQYPLDQVNKGKRDKAEVSGHELDGRWIAEDRLALVIGPESELWVVGPPAIARDVQLIQAKRLGEKEFVPMGGTELAIYAVEGEADDFRAANIVQENWQPLIPQDIVAQHGIIAKVDQLGDERTVKQFNGIEMTMRQYTPPDGSPPYEVGVLIPGSDEALVLPVTEMQALTAGPISELIEPGSVNRGSLTYRVKEDYVTPDGQATPMALVGDIQEMALIVPAGKIAEARDVRPADLDRSTRFKLNFDGYRKVLNLKLSGVPFWRFYLNSAFLVTMNTIGHLFSCVLVAYGFARLRAPGKDLLFLVLLGTMMVPYTIITLPTYIIFRDLGMLGTMTPLWVRSFFGNAFLIFVLRQFFMTIPLDLDEAATLDGANRLQILGRIILPLSRAALTTIAIFTFWWTWNSFLDPLIYTSRQQHYTLTLAMNTFNQQYARSAGFYDRILAGSVLTLLPMVIVFILAQRQFIEGIQMQGLKQ
jgi:ABC-type glycerol-3-phosphate transport system permease component